MDQNGKHRPQIMSSTNSSVWLQCRMLPLCWDTCFFLCCLWFYCCINTPQNVVSTNCDMLYRNDRCRVRAAPPVSPNGEHSGTPGAFYYGTYCRIGFGNDVNACWDIKGLLKRFFFKNVLGSTLHWMWEPWLIRWCPCNSVQYYVWMSASCALSFRRRRIYTSRHF